MAIYSLSISNVSRAAGSSTLATLSYITAQRARDERLGQTFYGFGRRERVEATGTLLPEGAPEEWRDPVKLFNALETYEKAANARCGKKMIVALPREWSLEASENVLREYIEEQLCRRGYAATYAIHTDTEGNNPHAHVLIANRVISKQGKWAAKARSEYVLDETGERVPLIDKATGEQKLGKRNERLWKRRKVSYNPLDQKDVLKDLRKTWADTANKYLDEADRIDHRSLREQGIDRLPTIHLGYASAEMVARGEPSERAQRAETIRKTNEAIAEVSRIEAMIERAKQGASEALIVLRSAIDHVLGDERLYKVKDFIDRLKDIGISVKEQAKDWVYHIEHGIGQGERASGSELGEEYTKESIEARLRSQGERLASSYDPQATQALQQQIKVIEQGQLPPAAIGQLSELDRQIRQIIHPVSQAQREADNAGIFARGKARARAQEAAELAQARLAQIIPWWNGEITPETANSTPEAIRDQARQIMRAEAVESLEGLKSDLETQNIYKDAHEAGKRPKPPLPGIGEVPQLKKLDHPTQHHPRPPWQRQQTNQNTLGRSR